MGDGVGLEHIAKQWKVNQLLYADDWVLTEDTYESLQKTVNDLEMCANEKIGGEYPKVR